MHKEKIILKCSPLSFYSQNDETALFEWLNKIRCIKSYKGVGRELHLNIRSKKISINDLKDLFGIFNRYNFDQHQLIVFKNDDNKDWFNE